MDRFRNLARSLLEAAALGLLATRHVYLAPLHVGESPRSLAVRRLVAAYPPTIAPRDDILVVRLDDPASIDTIAAARPRRTSPPPDFDPIPALRPLRTTASCSVRSRHRSVERRPDRTTWRDGGHLRFEPDMDGVVRNDLPLVRRRQSERLRSHCAPPSSIEGVPRSRAAALERSGPDGRRWLRFYPEHAFPEITAAEILAAPERLRGKVLIAGGADQAELTPLGPLTTNVLLAHILSGYLQDLSIAGGTPSLAIAWGLAAILIGVLGVLRAPSRTIAWLALAGASFGVLVAGAAAFGAANLWLPVTGPARLAVARRAACSRYATPRAARPQAQATRPRRRARKRCRAGDSRKRGRATGRSRRAPALFPEIYDLACATRFAHGNDRRSRGPVPSRSASRRRVSRRRAPPRARGPTARRPSC